jgi:hypothetical protein
MSALTDMRRELAALRADFDRRVVERVRLILQAERVAPGTRFDAGATDEHIRAKAVAAALGPAAIDGKPQAYIDARFDHLAEQQPVDPVAVVLAGRHARNH